MKVRGLKTIRYRPTGLPADLENLEIERVTLETLKLNDLGSKTLKNVQ